MQPRRRPGRHSNDAEYDAKARSIPRNFAARQSYAAFCARQRPACTRRPPGLFYGQSKKGMWPEATVATSVMTRTKKRKPNCENPWVLERVTCRQRSGNLTNVIRAGGFDHGRVRVKMSGKNLTSRAPEGCQCQVGSIHCQIMWMLRLHFPYNAEISASIGAFLF